VLEHFSDRSVVANGSGVHAIPLQGISDPAGRLGFIINDKNVERRFKIVAEWQLCSSVASVKSK
jgi:hypothetical protein